MTLNTKPKIRSRVRLTLAAQRCAACGATLLRGAWAWRDRSGCYTCDGPHCRPNGPGARPR